MHKSNTTTRPLAKRLLPAFLALFSITAAHAVAVGNVIEIVTPPTQTTAGKNMTGPPVVLVKDSGGSPASGVSVDVALNKNSFASGTTSVTTGVDGKATFADLKINKAEGGYKLTFKTANAADKESLEFPIVAAAPKTAEVVSQPSNSQWLDAVGGSPAVLLKDEFLNPANPGVGVTASVVGGGTHSTSTNTAVTNSEGKAVFTNLVPAAIGVGYKINFNPDAAGVADVESNTFDVTKRKLTVTGSFTANDKPYDDGITASIKVNNLSLDLKGKTIAANLKNNVTVKFGDKDVAKDKTVSIDTAEIEGTDSANCELDLTGAPTAKAEITPDFASAVITVTTEPSESVAGVAIAGAPKIKIEDQYDNQIPDYEVTASLNQNAFANSASDVASTIKVTTGADGTAEFDKLFVRKAQTGYKIKFSYTGTGLTKTVESSAFEVKHAAASKLVVMTKPSAKPQAGVAFVTQPTVQLLDQFDNEVKVASVDVSVAVSNGSGDLKGTLTQATDPNGLATFTDLRIDGLISERTLEFTSAALTSDNTSKVDVVAGPASKLTIVQQPSSEAKAGFDFANQPTVQIDDKFGNDVSEAGTKVKVEIATGDVDTLSGALEATTDAKGLATFSELKIEGKKGDRTLKFTTVALSPDGDVTSDTVKITPGTETKFVITNQPIQTTAGDQIESFSGSPEITVEDAWTNKVPNVGVTVRLKGGATGTTFFSGTNKNISDADGKVLFTDLVVTKASGDYQLEFKADVKTFTATSDQFAVIAAAANKIALNSNSKPSNKTAGVSLDSLDLQITDKYENPVVGAYNVTASVLGAEVFGTKTKATNASDGKVSFTDLFIKKSGKDYQITFTPAAAGITELTPEEKFDIEPDFASAVITVTTEPSESVAGVAIAGAPKIAIKDQYENPIPDYKVTASLSPSPNNFAKSATDVDSVNEVTTGADGTAEFDKLFIRKAQTGYKINFSYTGTGLTKSVESSAFEVKHAAATKLVVMTKPSAKPQAGVAFVTQPTVQLQDQFVNEVKVASVDVAVAVSNGSGDLEGTLAQATDANGLATFTDLRIDGLIGERTLEFTSAGLTSDNTSKVDVVAGPASKLAIVSQPSASSEAGDVFANQPSVQIDDQFGNDVSGAGTSVAVEIAAPGAGTLKDTLTATTNAEGLATFSGLKIEGLVGDRALKFTSGTLTEVTSNVVTIKPDLDTAVITVVTEPSDSVAGVAIVGSPKVVIKDQYTNEIPNYEVTASLSKEDFKKSATEVDSTTRVTTGVDGTAEFNNLFVRKADTGYKITFGYTATGLTKSVETVAFNVKHNVAYQLAIKTQPSSAAKAGMPFNLQPEVQVVDQFGNDVNDGSANNTEISASLAGGAASLEGTRTAKANAVGLAKFTDLRIDGVVGDPTSDTDRSIEFSSPGLKSDISTDIKLGHGLKTQLAVLVATPAKVKRGDVFATAPSFQITDAWGNAVKEADVPVKVEASGGNLVGTLTVNTNSDGVATFSDLKFDGNSGNYTLTYRSGDLSIPAPANVQVVLGVPASLVITPQPSSAAKAGELLAQQPAVTVKDADGKLLEGFNVTVSLTGSGALEGTTTAVTNASGVATFSGLLIKGAVGNYTLNFSTTGLPPVASNPIALSAGSASKLVIVTQPSSDAKARQVFAQKPVLEVQDASGNPVSEVRVTANLDGSGTLTGAKFKDSASNGQVTFSDLAINGTVGTYKLGFSATGLNATSAPISLIAGTATQLAVKTQPSATAKSGEVLATQPSVEVKDADGNAVEGVAVTVASSGGTLVGTTTATTGTDGVATFGGLKLNGSAAAYTLSFSATGGLNVTSSSINLSAGTATQLVVKTQPSTTAKSGEVLSTQPSIEIKDADGNGIKDVVVTVAASGAALGGTTTATTGIDGVATFGGLKLNGTVGIYTLSFSATGSLNATSSSISLSAGAATQFVVKTQPSTTAKSGEVLSTQPSVEIKDADGNAIKDVVVTVAASGATLSGTTTATTGIDGVATFGGLKITGTAGEYSMTFAAGALSATSAKINLGAGAATKLVILTQPSTSAESNVVLPSQPIVQLQDASGNGVNQSGSVTVAIETTASPAPTLAGSSSASMDASGLASFNNLRLNAVGSKDAKLKLVFSAAGFTIKSDEITLSPDRDRDGDGILTSIERARGMNPDSMDSNGNGLTDTYEFSYIGTTDPFLPRVGDYIKLDFSSLKIGSESSYNIVGKLPAGLAFNKSTGVLAGKLSGKEETVTLSLQFMNGKVVMRTVSLPIPIKPFPKGIAGTFQALLENGSGLQGMVSATLTAPGSWSATLDMRGSKNLLSAKGLFDLNPNEDTVTLRLAFPATPGVAATSLTLEIDGAFNLIDGTYTSGTTNGIANGFRMAQGDELAMVKNKVKANKPYTLVLDQGSQNGSDAPAGVGTATASLAQAGTIAFNGQLGDAQAVKGSLRVSATGQAIVWLKPYKNATSYIGGVFDLPSGILTSTPSESLETGLNWVRAADATETSYVSGFTLVIETPFMSEFVPRTKSTDLATDLGLTNNRFNVSLEGNDIQAQTGLPDKFDLNASFGLIVPSPVPNGVAWKKGLINKANGTITGALALKKLAPVNAGDAPVFGVVYKSGDNTRGIGLVRIPFVEDKKTRFRTNAIILSK